MEKEFVPYDIALAIKELGFDEPCLGYYTENDEELNLGEGYNIVTRYFRENVMSYKLNNSNFIYGTNKPIGLYNLTTSPLYQQAFRWFREKYNIHHSIDALFNGGGFRAVVVNHQIHNIVVIDDRFDSYEEAELACLKKLIEIVKQKQL